MVLIFNQSIDLLSTNLKYLTLSCYFDKSIDKVPMSLTHLTIDCFRSYPIDVLYDKGITYIHFGSYYNIPIDILPNKIECVAFGSSFNQSFDNTHINFNLAHLTFGRVFNQNVDNLLVVFPNLTYLNFGDFFNRSVDVMFTKTNKITHLVFGKQFNRHISNFPNTLQEITFRYQYYNINAVTFPKGVKQLNVRKDHIRTIDIWRLPVSPWLAKLIAVFREKQVSLNIIKIGDKIVELNRP